MSVVYLVRHGQASFGKSDYDRLTPLGERQAEHLGQALASRGLKPALVVSGRMRRHRRTADLTLAAAGIETRPVVDEGYDEFDHDQVVFAYRRREVMRAELSRSDDPAQVFQQIFEDATKRWVTGAEGYSESFAAFCARTEAALRRTAEAIGKGESALVFTSAGPIAAILSRLLTGTDDLWLALNPVAVNTGLSKVVSGRRGLTVVSYNDHAHLEGTDLLSYR